MFLANGVGNIKLARTTHTATLPPDWPQPTPQTNWNPRPRLKADVAGNIGTLTHSQYIQTKTKPTPRTNLNPRPN